MKVTALTSGVSTPSARFRIRQYIPLLNTLGIRVEERRPVISQGARLPGVLGRVRNRYLPPVVIGQPILNLALRLPGVIAARQSNITWLERNFVPGLDDFAWMLPRPLVLDIDDAIWLYNPLGEATVKRLVARADMVFAGNAFLADWCSTHNANVRRIPTAVDARRYLPAPDGEARDSDYYTIGWTGTSGNFRFLESIQVALAAFLKDHSNARLRILADRAPILSLLPANQVEFTKWSPENEHELLQTLDVGIMPIDDSDLSRGKCSFKMLQYMATGVPVIVSPYGMNKDVLSMGEFGIGAKSASEWRDALEAYYADRMLARRHGSAAREVILKAFDATIVAGHIANEFRALTCSYRDIG